MSEMTKPYTEPFDLRRELEMLRDVSLGFALCNMDHAGTRRDLKKAQNHVSVILATLTKAPDHEH